MKNEVVKVVSATVLCLVLFGAAFLGINNASLAVATEAVQPLQLAPATVNTHTERVDSIAPEERQKPDMVLTVFDDSDTLPGINALTPDEAAEIGAEYIWDMLGKSIDGKTVRMLYTANPSSARAYWHGWVSDTMENLIPTDRENFDLQCGFTICAVSGERIDIDNWKPTDNAFDKRMQEISSKLRVALIELSREESEKLFEQRNAHQPPERLAVYAQIAERYAAKHFNKTEVASSQVWEYNSFGSFDLDENGRIIIVPAQTITFIVTDSTGREAEVGINMETEELLRITTQQNDIVPGWNYVGEEPGLG